MGGMLRRELGPDVVQRQFEARGIDGGQALEHALSRRITLTLTTCSPESDWPVEPAKPFAWRGELIKLAHLLGRHANQQQREPAEETFPVSLQARSTCAASNSTRQHGNERLGPAAMDRQGHPDWPLIAASRRIEKLPTKELRIRGTCLHSKPIPQSTGKWQCDSISPVCATGFPGSKSSVVPGREMPLGVAVSALSPSIRQFVNPSIRLRGSHAPHWIRATARPPHAPPLYTFVGEPAIL